MLFYLGRESFLTDDICMLDGGGFASGEEKGSWERMDEVLL